MSPPRATVTRYVVGDESASGWAAMVTTVPAIGVAAPSGTSGRRLTDVDVGDVVDGQRHRGLDAAGALHEDPLRRRARRHVVADGEVDGDDGAVDRADDGRPGDLLLRRQQIGVGGVDGLLVGDEVAELGDDTRRAAGAARGRPAGRPPGRPPGRASATGPSRRRRRSARPASRTHRWARSSPCRQDSAAPSWWWSRRRQPRARSWWSGPQSSSAAPWWPSTGGRWRTGRAGRRAPRPRSPGRAGASDTAPCASTTRWSAAWHAWIVDVVPAGSLGSTSAPTAAQTVVAESNAAAAADRVWSTCCWSASTACWAAVMSSDPTAATTVNVGWTAGESDIAIPRTIPPPAPALRSSADTSSPSRAFDRISWAWVERRLLVVQLRLQLGGVDRGERLPGRDLGTGGDIDGGHGASRPGRPRRPG